MPDSMIPKVYVNAPYYVDKEEKFYINVEVRADDINRIDNVIVNGIWNWKRICKRNCGTWYINLKFGPFAIKENKTFEVKVILDDNGSISKKNEVKVKEI